jgi:nuclear receptor coactivator 4
VKSEIQTTVTRQLEALREREVYLLHQVDLIQQAKDAALQGQEDKLHQALGSLTTSLQVAETGQRTYSLADAMQK